MSELSESSESSEQLSAQFVEAMQQGFKDKTPVEIARTISVTLLPQVSICTPGLEKFVNEAMKKLPEVAMMAIMHKIDPGYVQGFIRNQLRCICLALSSNNAIFTDDELLQILEGRRSLKT
jgi:hypothetical protein